MRHLGRETPRLPHTWPHGGARAARALDPEADYATNVCRKLAIVRAHLDRDDPNVAAHSTLDRTLPPEAA